MKCLFFLMWGEGGLTKCLCKQKELNCTVGPISTRYFSVKVCQWNFDINMTNIICKLHAKLNFGIFCYSLRWLKKLLTFLSEIFFVTMFLFLPWKKRKQITTPISTFWFLYNKTLLQCVDKKNTQHEYNILLPGISLTNTTSFFRYANMFC